MWLQALASPLSFYGITGAVSQPPAFASVDRVTLAKRWTTPATLRSKSLTSHENVVGDFDRKRSRHTQSPLARGML